MDDNSLELYKLQKFKLKSFHPDEYDEKRRVESLED
jgi:hypothetical protein